MSVYTVPLEPISYATAEYNHTKEAPPKAGGHPRRCDPLKRDRHLPEKLPLHFGFCARPIFSFKKEKSVFLGCSALEGRAAGLSVFDSATRNEG